MTVFKVIALAFNLQSAQPLVKWIGALVKGWNYCWAGGSLQGDLRVGPA